MRALITGCAGFVGSHLAQRLLDLGHEVVGIDCLTPYYPEVIKRANLEALGEHRPFTFRREDLVDADLESLLDGVDLVYHEAAQPGVRASWGTFFETYTRNNVLATQRLLEACKGLPIRKFVYASSSSIYGDAETFPTAETVLPQPVSPYGVTKLAGEQLVYLYWRNYGVPTVALRYFTVYGPRQRPDMAFHRFIRWALDGEPIQIYGDGEQTRDFTFVSDAIAANVAAGMSAAEGVALNIGGGSRVTVNQVLALLAELIDRRLIVQHTGPERGDVRHTAADTTLAAKLLGYRPEVSLRDGLAAQVDSMRDARERWTAA